MLYLLRSSAKFGAKSVQGATVCRLRCQGTLGKCRPSTLGYVKERAQLRIMRCWKGATKTGKKGGGRTGKEEGGDAEGVVGLRRMECLIRMSSAIRSQKAAIRRGRVGQERLQNRR